VLGQQRDGDVRLGVAVPASGATARRATTVVAANTVQQRSAAGQVLRSQRQELVARLVTSKETTQGRL
jgi:hypothetical protein